MFTPGPLKRITNGLPAGSSASTGLPPHPWRTAASTRGPPAHAHSDASACGVAHQGDGGGGEGDVGACATAASTQAPSASTSKSRRTRDGPRPCMPISRNISVWCRSARHAREHAVWRVPRGRRAVAIQLQQASFADAELLSATGSVERDGVAGRVPAEIAAHGLRRGCRSRYCVASS